MTAIATRPLSEEAVAMIDALATAGAVITRVEHHDDELGVSVHWVYQGVRHSNGAATLELALAWTLLHLGVVA